MRHAIFGSGSAFVCAALASAGCDAATAAPEEFVIDSGHAFPTFEDRHLGIATQRGRFDKTTGMVLSNYGCTRKLTLVLRCGVDMSATFRRSEFGMSSMLSFVADGVTILIQAEAVQSARTVRPGKGSE